jgi:5-deoxy-glucuronate isomerase
MSIKLHLKANEILQEADPREIGLEYTWVQRLELDGTMQIRTGGNEICLACISGEFDYDCEQKRGRAVFKDMLYVPFGSGITVSSDAPAVIMKFGAPSDLKSKFAHLSFKEVDADPDRHKVYGSRETNSQRHVWDFIDDRFPASRLLAGMCESERGGWTAWPPHEHAVKREEVYVYFNMGHGFGIQCVYEDMNNPLAVALVRDGDLVSVPKGYHPSVGCPAGKMSYVYCMVSKTAGDRKFMDLNLQQIYGDKFV